MNKVNKIKSQLQLHYKIMKNIENIDTTLKEIKSNVSKITKYEETNKIAIDMIETVWRLKEQNNVLQKQYDEFLDIM